MKFVLKIVFLFGSGLSYGQSFDCSLLKSDAQNVRGYADYALQIDCSQSKMFEFPLKRTRSHVQTIYQENGWESLTHAIEKLQSAINLLKQCDLKNCSLELDLAAEIMEMTYQKHCSSF